MYTFRIIVNTERKEEIVNIFMYLGHINELEVAVFRRSLRKNKGTMNLKWRQKEKNGSNSH